MKRWIAILAFLLVPSIFYAQGFGIGLQVGPQIPISDFGDAFDVGLGFNGVFEYAVSNQFTLNFTSGYHWWSETAQEEGVEATHRFTAIPLIAGFSFLFLPYGTSPFAGLKLGVHIETESISISAQGIDLGSESETQTHFGITPEVGVLIPVTQMLDIVLSAEYNHIFGTEGGIDVTYFGINGGVLIHLGHH